ncbi:DUF1850 domain-containing protein [Lipingzhangella sp. LS1_29]|uniref:DUF1850 domain-containing protein n=1 Tax=Lipingzhangella rawalii TaxID=2055835 RepID=A0ABU2H8N1_9ACTN|nr:DUF1850 domain-containing protein [Lipingzhangella rawalii]MDS1271675.1 DUF1850 domain-containing protein [Lipingzhangella rawalii]
MLATALLLAGALVLTGDAPAWRMHIAVVDHDTSVTLWSEPVEVGERIRLEHTHSVHGRPVVEVFSVSDGDGLALEEMRFDATGANLPSRPEQIGDVTTTFVNDGDQFRVVHHGRILGTVPLRVGGPMVDHTVTTADGVRVRFLDLAPRGTHVELRVQGMPGP